MCEGVVSEGHILKASQNKNANFDFLKVKIKSLKLLLTNAKISLEIDKVVFHPYIGFLNKTVSRSDSLNIVSN